MQVRDILQHKGQQVHSIEPEATLTQAAQKMMEHRCGSLVVQVQDQLVGIITERDVLRVCATGQSLGTVCVHEQMTRRVVTGSPADDLRSIMGVLTNKRVRHLPVLEEGKLVGMISIGDVVKSQYDELAFENHVLKSYIHS
jgi:CBS domain-containing protein